MDAFAPSPSTLDRLIDLAALPAAEIPASALRIAGFSLFDWIVVARKGAGEPLAGIVRDLVAHEGGREAATVVGAATRVPARAAALANGTTSHALDYDDTHFAHVGHPSVGVAPAALAVGEETGATASAVRDAFLIGAEASVRAGMALGRAHYLAGFHQTATAGAFGATVAAGRLYGLDATRMRHALGLVSTRASGLKSQFGTMGKPYNAGIAAANGVEAAALAARGFTSCDDGFGGPQGFVETHHGEGDLMAWAEPPPERFIFEDVKYKLHACCHGVHAMLEALAKLPAMGIPERLEVRTNPRWLRVCDIKSPRTGLEVKFSYAYLAAMALTGRSTRADESYVDALCGDPELGRLASRVVVTGDEGLSDMQAEVTLEAGGRRGEAAHDLAAPLPASVLEEGLRGKAATLLGDAAADRLWQAVSGLDSLSASDLAALLND